MSVNCSKVLSLILEIAAVLMIDARIAKTYSCRTNKTKSFEFSHYRNQFHFPVGKFFPFNNFFVLFENLLVETMCFYL